MKIPLNAVTATGPLTHHAGPAYLQSRGGGVTVQVVQPGPARVTLLLAPEGQVFGGCQRPLIFKAHLGFRRPAGRAERTPDGRALVLPPDVATAGEVLFVMPDLNGDARSIHLTTPAIRLPLVEPGTPLRPAGLSDECLAFAARLNIPVIGSDGRPHPARALLA